MADLDNFLATIGALGNAVGYTGPDLGLSPQSEYTRDALGAMQGQGQQPEMGGAVPLMMQLIDALARSKPHDPPQPKAPQQQPQSVAGDLQMLNTPGAASANAPANLELLQALLAQ